MFSKFASLLICVLFIALPACSSSPSPANVSEPVYAGEMTEGILLAMNAGDYAKFSQNFDDAMKKAIPQSAFEQQILGTVKGKIGDYTANSRKFIQGSIVNGNTVLAYQPQFTNEPAGVIVTISFKETNGIPSVTGLFFNSPKLRGG